MTMETEILQRMYESKISFGIIVWSAFGIEAFLLPETRNFPTIHALNLHEVIRYLAAQAVDRYPDSDFAKWWKEQNKEEEA